MHIRITSRILIVCEKQRARRFLFPSANPRPAHNRLPKENIFRLGKLEIETRLTWGHSRGGTTFVVNGLAHPVAIVGDSLFAGSMGGGSVSYGTRLKIISKKF